VTDAVPSVIGMNRILTFLTVLASAWAAAAPAHPAAGNAGPPPAACAAASPGWARCLARVVPLATATPSGYSPAQFHAAYRLPRTTPASARQTIAVVDAYDDPAAKRDLNVYDTRFGLPFFPFCSATVTSSCFRKVNGAGAASPMPSTDPGWALEISLDVQVAHGVCQDCSILLVEARSAGASDLAAAVNTAVRLGANVVSNSYGVGESATQAGSALAAAYDHPGVAVIASAGDSGYGTAFPAALATVVAVGGTTLRLHADGTYAAETAWPGSGSGCSRYIAARTWQTRLAEWRATGCGSRRAIADVAADADPATGASVYDSTPVSGSSGWFRVGGTSLAAPIIAAAFGLAGNSGSLAYPAAWLYAHRAGLRDVNTGSNGVCATVMCTAAPGYDGPTGLGTPVGTGGF
jgi:subtilase family serine protease